MDLFAYDRSQQEAIDTAKEAEAAEAAAAGKIPGAAASGEVAKGENSGRRRDGACADGDDSRGAPLRAGALPQIMARLQLQSHINQVIDAHHLSPLAEM